MTLDAIRLIQWVLPPSSCVPPAPPHYQWLLVLVGFDAADEVGLAAGQDFHQLV